MKSVWVKFYFEICILLFVIFFNVVYLFCYFIFLIVINCMYVNYILMCKILNFLRYNIFGGFVYVFFIYVYIKDDVIFVGCDYVLYKIKLIIKELEIGE